MNKKLMSSALVAAFISTFAYAGGPELPPADVIPPMPTPILPFLGVNYSYLKADGLANIATDAGTVGQGGTPYLTNASIPDSFNGITFEGGFKYGQYFAAVFGYSYFFKETITGNDTSYNPDQAVTLNTTPSMVYLDARGYLPLYNFDLILSVGANVFDAGIQSLSTLIDSGAVDFRLGGGFDYYFTPNWGIQALYTWIPSHNTSNYNDLWTVTAGLYYMFS
ncbi:MAG: hypothetical protein A3J38_02035 [Gammaproteobacteria bacterium RIFCSPHIGHO2_12_FULL_45_9]|nr:MAG: hypothetical protein A3J38_02035 [Gammaproteobacteria bacterium RIFCSPHIGHO2_12_FULL_45_9]